MGGMEETMNALWCTIYHLDELLHRLSAAIDGEFFPRKDGGYGAAEQAQAGSAGYCDAASQGFGIFMVIIGLLYAYVGVSQLVYQALVQVLPETFRWGATYAWGINRYAGVAMFSALGWTGY